MFKKIAIAVLLAVIFATQIQILSAQAQKTKIKRIAATNRIPPWKKSMLFRLDETSHKGRGKYWVFFTDKGLHSHQDTTKALEEVKKILTPRALRRRAKVLPADSIVDWRDIPVNPDYLRQVEETGAQIVHITRWFNGVSVYADSQQILRIGKFPFVSEIRPVAVRRTKIGKSTTIEFIPTPSDALYGLAAEQLHSMDIPPIHKMGIFGDGVLVCITDTGFNLEHSAVRHCDIVGVYDFVDGDSVVDLQPGDNPAIVSHGTKCWSEIGGRVDSLYWGAAPEASFLLARTEDLDTEWVGEEDNWVAAAEWAESLGVDVISVSLGYFGWYTADDLDGDTPIITAAADRAAMLGVAVFVAAGNSGTSGYRTLTAPGDGDSVITVGACDSRLTLASFSSRGPTADGRLKPDVIAHGVGTICANGMSDSTFGGSSGTSMATPMAAGIGTLILSAKRSLSPMQLLHCLRMTADQAITPDSARGWGAVDAAAAIAYPENDTSFVYLHANWNLFALPVDTIIPTTAIPGLTTAFSFLPDSMTFVPVDSLRPGTGYFIHIERDTFAVLVGRPITELTINLRRGWNLIGGLSRRTFVIELDKYPIADFFIYTPKGYALAPSLTPSRAGWFWARKDTTITLRE